MVTARDPAVLRESRGGSSSWHGHTSVGSVSSEQDGQADKPCYWVNIWTRLNAMRNCLQLCDIDLEAEDGAMFRAHSAVLAASSDVFHSHLMQKKSSVLTDAGDNKVLVQGVSGPALKVTLDFVYGIAPTNPEELSLLMEGSQVMGVSGALAFCKRNSVLVRREESLSSAISPAAPCRSGGQSTATSERLRETVADVQTQEVTADGGGNRLTDVAQEVNPFARRHNDFVLDLSLNDLESMSKCPVLNELAGESTGSVSSGMLPESRHSPANAVGRQDASREQVSDGLDVNVARPTEELGAMNGDMDPVADDQIEKSNAELREADDFGLNELSCPFAKSVMYESKAPSQPNGMSAMHQAVDDCGKVPGEPILQCPFLKSLGDMTPDAMMKVDEGDRVQKMTPSCSSGKVIQSLHPLSGAETGAGEQHGKLANFSTDLSSSAELLPDDEWQDISEEKHQVQAVEQGIFEQYPVNGLLDGKAAMLSDDKVANVCRPEGSHQLAAMINQPPIDQNMLCDAVPAASGQAQLSPSQNVPSGQMNQLTVSECQMTENQMTSFGAQFQATAPMFPSSFASVSDNGNMNYNRIVSSGQEIFGPLDSEKNCPGTSCHQQCDGRPFAPKVCTEKDAPFYTSSGSEPSSSLVDLIYSNVSGAGCPPTSSLSPCSRLGSTARVPANAIAVAAKPIPNLLPSPSQCNRSAVTSPNSGHQLASPSRPTSWEGAASPNVDNATIKARLKLNRGQEYVCLIENCCYSNKCLDYMQSHMYRKHGMGHPDVTCSLCQKAFFSLGQLKGHTKRAHKPETRPSDAEAVRCEDCDEMFTNVQKLQTHRLKSHCKGRLFTCEECDFRSPRKKDVQAHMVSQHKKIPPGVQVFECVHCSYKCTDKNRAEEHQAMHTGQPKFVCKICGKSYTTRRGMRTHMQYHSTERPHRCETCNAAFKVRSKLRDHVRLVHTHVGIKPYECGYCGHKTALRGNCNQHCRKHHPNLPVCVIDHHQGERRHKRSYDYAGLKGDGIEECRDVRKHLRAVSP